MSRQGSNICLAGFRDATPHLAGCRQYSAQALYQEFNWEQGGKTTQLQVFALLKRQPQNRVVWVFELITVDFKNSHLNQLVTFAIVT